MDDLRIILLLAGAALIGGVYFWAKLQQRPAGKKIPHKPARVAPGDNDDSDIAEELASMGKLVAERDHDPELHKPVVSEGTPNVLENYSEKLLVISVIAEDGEPFDGDKLLNAFSNNSLVQGKKGIYERHVTQNGHETPVFGLANLVKPGTFPRDMRTFATPGLTLFLQLPCAIGALDAFDDFMNTAERLAVQLAGELRDENQKLLTHQALMQVRERVAESQARMHMAAS
ncbi:hypothetical protein MNBD_GAMMA15-412 [hydrothermal vent metagenome]|uniref:ZipA C-terminal FtsZ-binding domain-containing protein n=1 Tax=hydrothermal vent metagenome TaxID=652676 RepID=A0A3B0YQB7_9ZZZZ